MYFNDSFVTDLSCKIMHSPPNDEAIATIGINEEVKFLRLVILVISKKDLIITAESESALLKTSFKTVVTIENDTITAQILKMLMAEFVIEEIKSGFLSDISVVFTQGLKILFVTIAINAFAAKQDIKIIIPAISSLYIETPIIPSKKDGPPANEEADITYAVFLSISPFSYISFISLIPIGYPHILPMMKIKNRLVGSEKTNLDNGFKIMKIYLYMPLSIIIDDSTI